MILQLQSTIESISKNFFKSISFPFEFEDYNFILYSSSNSPYYDSLQVTRNNYPVSSMPSEQDKKDIIQTTTIFLYLLQFQLGFKVADYTKLRINIEFMPENVLEKDQYEKLNITHIKQARGNAFITTNFDVGTMKNQSKKIDPISFFIDAENSTLSVSKFRDYYRVLEYYSAEFTRKDRITYGKLSSEEKITKIVNNVFGSQKVSILDVEIWKDLRDQCSHSGEKNNYISNLDRVKVHELDQIIPELRIIAKKVIEKSII